MPPGKIKNARHPFRIGQPQRFRSLAGHGFVAQRLVGRHPPVVWATRGGDAAGAHIALVGHHHPRAGFGGGECAQAAAMPPPRINVGIKKAGGRAGHGAPQAALAAARAWSALMSASMRATSCFTAGISSRP
jgi:hypothetical protein